MVDMKTKMCIFTNNKIEGNEELHEGNVFCNCIMVIHNFIVVDGTGYLLLVMADKGGKGITMIIIVIFINIKNWTL